MIERINRVPVRPDSRNAVYDVIDGERDYQAEHFPDDPELGSQLLLIEAYLAKTRAAFADANGDGARTLGYLRKTIALGIRALESNGAIPREWHVPASANITGEWHVRDLGDKLAPPAEPVLRLGPPPVEHAAPEEEIPF